MKKFIPLLLIGALLSSISCRQTDELETSPNAVNSNSISLKENGIVNTNTAANDSLTVVNLSTVEGNTPPRKDTDGW